MYYCTWKLTSEWVRKCVNNIPPYHRGVIDTPELKLVQRMIQERDAFVDRLTVNIRDRQSMPRVIRSRKLP